MISWAMRSLLLLAAITGTCLCVELDPSQRLNYLQNVGLHPEQLEALSRYEELRDEHERQVQLQQEAYERELNYLEELEQEKLREKYALREDILRIPGEQPAQNDTYLCTAFKQPTDRYIVGFEPLADSHKIHHILIFGCDKPGINRRLMPTWNCGEMSDQVDHQYVHASPCSGTPSIIYAYAKGAPKLDLPEGVAFHVGGESTSQYLVLQVHYMHEANAPDYSGVKIHYSEVPQPRLASTLLVVTGGEVAPKTRETFEAACVVEEPVVLHPFAFRVHTHKHGEMVSGWIVQEDENGKDEWHLIGQRSPQKEQLFEEVKNKSLVITQNDIIAARCVINNDENHTIQVGPYGNSIMCNYYLSYFVEADESRPLSDNTCYSPGPPNYHWGPQAGLNHIPN
ncbi:putative peptidylglycine alpha-hydroxylating monooxygenase 1, protein [Aphelenchoides besseyi]|nr:putative peptidylglycine alpha-hydroxylating monooxygenase 1, protein [Aphelenchoides besseyi]